MKLMKTAVIVISWPVLLVVGIALMLTAVTTATIGNVFDVWSK